MTQPKHIPCQKAEPLSGAVFNKELSSVQGGRFELGFISAFTSSLALSYTTGKSNDPLAIMGIGAAIGGTAESLGGGKFANGAVTGAFVGLFNDMMHLEENPQTQVYAEPLNDSDRKILLSKVKSATLAERRRNYYNRANYDNPEYELQNNIYEDFNIDGLRAGIYTAGSCELFCGNKTVTAEIAYTPSNVTEKNYVVGFTTPGTDYTNGRVWLVNENSYKHPIVMLRFESRQDYNTYLNFINGR